MAGGTGGGREPKLLRSARWAQVCVHAPTHTQAMWGYTFSYLGVEADEYNTFITTPSLASNDEKEQRE